MRADLGSVTPRRSNVTRYFEPDAQLGARSLGLDWAEVGRDGRGSANDPTPATWAQRTSTENGSTTCVRSGSCSRASFRTRSRDSSHLPARTPRTPRAQKSDVPQALWNCR